MSLPRLRPLAAFTLVVALLAGCLALAYARWAAPLLDAEHAFAAGDVAAALEGYAAAERRFARFAMTRWLFGEEHSASAYNQLALLYRAGDYDAVIQKAAAAPAGAAPRFWSGLALLQLGMSEGYPATQVVWFTRAEEELRQALQDAPDDWDTKVNYEIAARIVAELRRDPKRKTDTPMQLLRPQPAQGPLRKKTG